VVGLFADQPLDEVNDTIRACRLDRAQLCGAESIDFCRKTEAGVIKVLHVAGGQSEETVIADLAERVSAYGEAGHLVTLDRLVAGIPGGTGERFDWTVAEEMSRRGHSFLLAGGLRPENVAEAIARVKPWGVDVSTGVETDGKKDPEKIRDFVRSARQL
jgi:phosphoribosylanthranilate isomerase